MILKHNLKQKLSLSLIVTILSLPCAFANQLDELSLPKKPAYRLGTSNEIETEYKVFDIQKEAQAKYTYNREKIKNLTYADSTLKDISLEISKGLSIDKENMLEDVQILWTGAATKSETIKFALYKLANPDADKPDENMVKKVIRPLANFSSIAGAGFMNPLAATTALMGGSLANALTLNDKDLNYKYTKLNDADMIILIRKVDDLQKRMMSDYFDYMSASESLKMSNQNLSKRKRNYELAKNSSNEALLMADAYYRVALDNKSQMELDFLAKRAALEQLVGSQALREFELKLLDREKSSN
ncbi:MAG: hypothetical protein PHV37_06740 [Candidatus Gastranaerophilales bacterium]|nr:hypothetical protein [Candidatus Gastranaerophilales bacterium]